VVLVVFLPPLLYGAAFFANFRDMRANLRGLTLSSVGLVLATMAAVAVVAHALIPACRGRRRSRSARSSRPPTRSRRRDHAAARRAAAAGERIEGEGLFNDATALVAYRSRWPRSSAAASRSPTPG
jgi:hypothetical protein